MVWHHNARIYLQKERKYKVVFVFCMDDINKTNSFNSRLSKGKIKEKKNGEQTVLLKTYVHI